MIRPLLRWTIQVYALIAVFILLSLLFGQTGVDRTTEFSPDLLATRTTTQYLWCGLRITRAQTVQHSTPLQTYLLEHGFIQPVSQPRWQRFAHTIVGEHICYRTGWREGRTAEVLNNIPETWLTWSHCHPDLAKQLWPTIVHWARDGEYARIRLLFSFNEMPRTAEALKSDFEGVEILSSFPNR